MGLYDTFIDGNKQGQVKCYESRLNVFIVGNKKIPPIDKHNTYSIALREGGYAVIMDNEFIGIKTKPTKPVFDKYGNQFIKATDVDMLQDLFNMQTKLQNKLGTMPFASQGERQNFITIQTLACLDELHEALRETQWKPWSKKQVYNQEKFQEELVDAWHFLINLTIASRMSAGDLHSRFVTKNDENIDRQNRGY